MRYCEITESGIFLTLNQNQYHMNLPQPYINDTIKENALEQSLIPGSFLLGIFNMDSSCIEWILDMLIDDLNDTEYVGNVVTLDDMIDNCRDTIASFMIKDQIFDYCVKNTSDIYIFSELVATQVFDTIALTEDNDCLSNLSTIIQDLRKIQMFSYMILEDKTISKDCLSIIKQHTPQIYFDMDNNGQLVEKYYIRSIFELFALDVYMYLHFPSKMCFCKLCGRYFIKNEQSREVHCQYPNPNFGGKSCSEYHKANPNYQDPISRIVSNAIKAQNRYYNTYSGLDDNSHELWHKWMFELKKKEKKARITKDTASLEEFIKNTRFSKTGFSNVDYSDYI